MSENKLLSTTGIAEDLQAVTAMMLLNSKTNIDIDIDTYRDGFVIEN